MAAIIRKMSVSEWINVPDNPRQRDTVRHARKAKRTHLATSEEPHQVVMAAMMDGEVRWKLDGHTRAYLWENGELPTPTSKLTVICFSVKNQSEAKRLYLMFDNQAAAENACDRLSGACREHGIPLASPLLRSHKFVLALQCASNEKQPRREYDYVKMWKDELIELDSWDLGSGSHTSFVSLALVLIANGHQVKAKEFFTKLDKDQGIKDDKGSDGVQALNNHFIERRSGRTTAGWDNIEDLFERSYTCFLAFAENRRMKSGPKRIKRETFCKVRKSLPKIAKQLPSVKIDA